MEGGEIRAAAAVTILPPREGFSPRAIGAVGMMVRLMAGPDDIVIGQDPGPGAFATPPFMAVPRVAWPLFGRNERYAAGAAKLLRALRPAQIEVHNRANLALDAARAAPGARVTLFLHNDPQAMRRARRQEDRAALLRRMRVVCVSGYLRDRFMEGVPAGAGQALHLPNAIDLDAMPPALPASAREPTMLFAGRAVADKGADAFVRAFGRIRAQLPGWNAVLIGVDRFTADSPETPFLAALRPMAAAAGVVMLGHQTHEAVLGAMARAAIVVVPSRWQEPFGLAALEAMASGAALICAPHGGLPELAGTAALYASPDPPGVLEDAMLRLGRDPAQRRALAEAGLARALQFNAHDARARLQALRAG